MTEWIATERQQVAVHLTDGRVLTGDVHLQLAQHHFGQETIADFFNRDEAFFVLAQPDGAVAFLAKGQTLYVELLIPPDLPSDPRATAAQRFGLAVDLTDGTRLLGTVLVELPPDRLRALDFLNAAPPFFPLWSPEAVRLINRVWIRAAAPLLDGERGSN